MDQLLARNAAPIAREWLAHSPALLIEGARQVGKSTFGGMLLDSGGQRLSLDDVAVRDAARADPVGLVSTPGPLLIDEVQHVPELMLTVKAEIDRDRRPGRFILTGSSSMLRVRGLTDSLAGRMLRLTLYGLSQGELKGVVDDLIQSLADPKQHGRIPAFTTQATRDDYIRACTTGAYPEPQSFPTRVRNAWLDSYVEAILGRDLSDIRRQVQPDRARSLVRVLAALQAQELVKARVGNLTNIPAATVDSYLDLLKDVFLYEPLPPWTPNLAKREVGRPKALIPDGGIAARLAGVSADQLSALTHREAFGHLLEGFVASELRRQQTWSTEDYRLFHYRSHTGVEVDLVAELFDGRVIAFEIKASATYQASQFKGLKVLRDELGDRFVGGFVLGTAAGGYRHADRLWGLPVGALWEFTAQ